MKLYNKIINDTDLTIEKVKHLLDLTLILQYINRRSHYFKIYVADRVKHVLESTSVEAIQKLYYIEAITNSDDICSRGVFNSKDLLQTNMGKTGG